MLGKPEVLEGPVGVGLFRRPFLGVREFDGRGQHGPEDGVGRCPAEDRAVVEVIGDRRGAEGHGGGDDGDGDDGEYLRIALRSPFLRGLWCEVVSCPRGIGVVKEEEQGVVVVVEEVVGVVVAGEGHLQQGSGSKKTPLGRNHTLSETQRPSGNSRMKCPVEQLIAFSTSSSQIKSTSMSSSSYPHSPKSSTCSSSKTPVAHAAQVSSQSNFRMTGGPHCSFA
mmetsp:Transcript_10247/g.33861  ORF Transcript_10247/g.33861 Transcript_10247/m.33861 type:complete len:223 (-) Transcript_10247:164-832(-)